MKLINKLLKISAIIIVTFSAMIGFAQAKDVSMSEFVKLDFEKRVAICAKIVASSEIGDCASILTSEKETVTTADLMAKAGDCFTGTVTDSQMLGKCVSDKFDKGVIPAGFPSQDTINKAYNYCAKLVPSSELGACTASLCTRAACPLFE